MDAQNSTQRVAPTTSTGMDHSEEILAEVDEPPDEWSPTKLDLGFLRAKQPAFNRRESLLTRQLHSETEHTDEEPWSPPRTLSTQSTWSNQSATSMTELTSDDGHSVASPAISPPLPPTQANNALPVPAKPLDQHVKIVGQDLAAPVGEKAEGSEKSVEANLGRKRCISFACRGKQESKPVQPLKQEAKPSEPTSPPKRKCMLKFVCPSKSASETKPTEKTQSKRTVSPPPPTRRPSASMKHRGSDSTVTHASPKSVRKNSPTSAPVVEQDSQPPVLVQTRRLSVDSSDGDTGKEAMRFHEFGTSEDEPEEWVQESTCHRSRLTVSDTLQKENVIRKTCEEVEEEALEEEEEDEEEDLDDELATVADMDDGAEAVDDDEEEESDEGFHSDDEDGFANSDSEGDDSDYEWWKPGNVSTAATSVEALDRLAIFNSKQALPSSSHGSASSAQLSRHSSKASARKVAHRRRQTPAVTINKPIEPDLPDSTDFVCGTLDEDRPLEQAYINRRKMIDAAKHKMRPQDIDPTFPTSDPEMDEEDDDDVDEVAESESEDDDLMHGTLEELHGTPKRPSPMHQMRPRGRSNPHRSPPPPGMRKRSPAPTSKRITTRSPPPPMKRITTRSPPPPTKRGLARSPAPRKLFGLSPIRTVRSKSPAPLQRMTSPPNSPMDATAVGLATIPHGLAGRPQLTHTASLPRGGGITLSNLPTIVSDDEDTNTGAPTAIPKRGAIDIVKGVEWKRKIRKEKLYQKMCAKAAAKGEKPTKVKPGKGCQRMREVGLQLNAYQGKAEHILSL